MFKTLSKTLTAFALSAGLVSTATPASASPASANPRSAWPEVPVTAAVAFHNAEQLPEKEIRTIGRRTLHFGAGSTSVGVDQRRTLQAFGRALRNNPYRRIVVRGHSDDVGSARSVQDMSRSRAQAVAVELLIAGISPDQLIVEAVGDREPAADCQGVHGHGSENFHEMNRRVELVVEGIFPADTTPRQQANSTASRYTGDTHLTASIR